MPSDAKKRPAQEEPELAVVRAFMEHAYPLWAARVPQEKLAAAVAEMSVRWAQSEANMPQVTALQAQLVERGRGHVEAGGLFHRVVLLRLVWGFPCTTRWPPSPEVCRSVEWSLDGPSPAFGGGALQRVDGQRPVRGAPAIPHAPCLTAPPQVKTQAARAAAPPPAPVSDNPAPHAVSQPPQLPRAHSPKARAVPERRASEVSLPGLSRRHIYSLDPGTDPSRSASGGQEVGLGLACMTTDPPCPGAAPRIARPDAHAAHRQARAASYESGERLPRGAAAAQARDNRLKRLEKLATLRGSRRPSVVGRTPSPVPSKAPAPAPPKAVQKQMLQSLDAILQSTYFKPTASTSTKTA